MSDTNVKTVDVKQLEEKRAQALADQDFEKAESLEDQSLKLVENKTSEAEEKSKELRVAELKEKIDAILDDSTIKLASIVFVVEGEDEPQACRKGHFYDVATMVNYVMGMYQSKALTDLGLRP